MGNSDPPTSTTEAATRDETKVDPASKDSEAASGAKKEEAASVSSAVPHLLFCGTNRWDTIGRSGGVPKAVAERGGSDAGLEFWAPTRFIFEDFPDVRFRAIFSGPCASHLVLVDQVGHAYGLGRNDNGQLACDSLKSQISPTRFELPDGPHDVQSVSCGRSHTVLVTEAGKCFSVGLNLSGQLGNKAKVGPTCVRQESSWQTVQVPSFERVVSVAAGADFSIFACESGAVYTAGSGQFGQLGNGRTGESIGIRNSVSFDTLSEPTRIQFDDNTKITQVAAGTAHSLALDSKGKVWSWGFGGYGRLGHKLPNDELRPRCIDTLLAPHYKMDYVTCGSTSSFAVQRDRGTTFFWGITKKSGESNMYPKPVYDLQGNDMHCLCSGATSTVAASEKSVVSWGPSPTFGELGYGAGNPKSSTKIRVLELIEGLCCTSLAEGTAFTAMIVNVATKEEEAILEKLDIHDIAEDGDVEEEEVKTTKSSGKRKSTATRKAAATKSPGKGGAKASKKRKKTR